ncbi:MAG: Crp/Fnr family transcriptional regulator [Acidimicrobiia bacterium]
MNRDTRIDLLRSLWLFERCSRKELEAIARVTTLLDVPAGRVLARQGQAGQECFVIVSGKVEAKRSDTRVGDLGPGQFFGEMALLERQPRVATVIATEPTTVLVLTAKAFDNLVATMPSVDRKMLVVLAHRLRDLENRYVPERARVLASDVA